MPQQQHEHTVYLGLGSNLGDKEEHLRQAVQLIEKQIGTVRRQSAFYYSEPWGFQSPNSFVNQVVMVITTLSPRTLLQTTQRIERQLGKRPEHATERHGEVVYHDRPVDIDILLFDNLTVNEPDLVIPHPLMHLRPFVMEPLKEVLF